MNRELLIEQLEQRLEITLPRGLRSLLEAAPARDMWYKGYLCCDAERLLVFNLELREGGDIMARMVISPGPEITLRFAWTGAAITSA
jgi:hypothetical protein